MTMTLYLSNQNSGQLCKVFMYEYDIQDSKVHKSLANDSFYSWANTDLLSVLVFNLPT